MKTPTHADYRRAEELADERALACQAKGCPRRWSVDHGGSRLCSAHALALPHDWPAITERLLWEDAELGRAAGARPPERQRGLLDLHPLPPTPEARAALEAAHAAIEDRIGRVVVERWLALRERERAGERLTRYQAEAWRAGLRLPAGADCWALAWFEQKERSGW